MKSERKVINPAAAPLSWKPRGGESEQIRTCVSGFFFLVGGGTVQRKISMGENVCMHGCVHDEEKVNEDTNK